MREAIIQYVQLFSNHYEDRRESALIASAGVHATWSEPLPDCAYSLHDNACCSAGADSDSSKFRHLLWQTEARDGHAGHSCVRAISAVTSCPRTSTMLDAQMITNKLFIVPLSAIGAAVGQLEITDLAELDLALCICIQLA